MSLTRKAMPSVCELLGVTTDAEEVPVELDSKGKNTVEAPVGLDSKEESSEDNKEDPDELDS
jgi:hypothetical protein